jgi:hypothetical protein
VVFILTITVKVGVIQVFGILEYQYASLLNVRAPQQTFIYMTEQYQEPNDIIYGSKSSQHRKFHNSGSQHCKKGSWSSLPLTYTNNSSMWFCNTGLAIFKSMYNWVTEIRQNIYSLPFQLKVIFVSAVLTKKETKNSLGFFISS